MANEKFTIEENAVLFNQAARTATGSDNVVEFSGSVYHRAKTAHMRNGYINNDGEHTLALESGITAGEGDWYKPGLFYQTDGKNKVFIYGNLAFTAPDRSSELTISTAIPEALRPNRAIYAYCIGSTQSGTAYAQQRILEMFVTSTGELRCDLAASTGAVAASVNILKSCIMIEYYVDSDHIFSTSREVEQDYKNNCLVVEQNGVAIGCPKDTTDTGTDLAIDILHNNVCDAKLANYNEGWHKMTLGSGFTEPATLVGHGPGGAYWRLEGKHRVCVSVNVSYTASTATKTVCTLPDDIAPTNAVLCYAPSHIATCNWNQFYISGNKIYLGWTYTTGSTTALTNTQNWSDMYVEYYI